MKISFELVLLTQYKNGVNKYFQIHIKKRNKKVTPKKTFNKINDTLELSIESTGIISNIGITAKSWNNKIQRHFCQYSLLISWFSFNIFNTIAVDDRVNHIHIIIAIL